MKKTRAVVLVFAVLVGGLVVVLWTRDDTLAEGLIQASGRIEGDEITISADVSGRIVELAVREGDRVEVGQVLVRLDDRAVRARVEQAEQALAVAEVGIEKARAEHAASEARLRSAEKSLALLREEVPLGIESASAELARARAALATAVASEQKTRRDHQRAERLFRRDAIADEDLDAAELLWVEAQNTVGMKEASVRIAEQRLADARLGNERLLAEQADVQRIDAEVARAATAIQASEARRDEARAALDEARSTLEDLTIVAPSPGTIVTRIAEPGEVVVAGSPLYDLVDLDRLYLKAYVRQQDIGKLRLGVPARIHTDAFPEQPYEATLGHIASRAEFTPREVHTPEQRVKLVFAVKLFLDENPQHRLTPGLPADAVIRWRDDVEWRNPQW
jgi:HlyD family secretion protein